MTLPTVISSDTTKDAILSGSLTIDELAAVSATAIQIGTECARTVVISDRQIAEQYLLFDPEGANEKHLSDTYGWTPNRVRKARALTRLTIQEIDDKFDTQLALFQQNFNIRGLIEQHTTQPLSETYTPTPSIAYSGAITDMVIDAINASLSKESETKRFVWRRVEGLTDDGKQVTPCSMSEIAAILNCSAAAVRTHYVEAAHRVWKAVAHSLLEHLESKNPQTEHTT